MARLKPKINIPYKRYEKSFDRSVENDLQEDGFVVLKDITANPSIATTNLKQERPDENTPEGPAPENPQDETKKTPDNKEITLNKKIKIRRKLR